jgi:hypothetical protein
MSGCHDDIHKLVTTFITTVIKAHIKDSFNKKGKTHIILENVHAPTVQIPAGPPADKDSHSVHREE